MNRNLKTWKWNKDEIKTLPVDINILLDCGMKPELDLSGSIDTTVTSVSSSLSLQAWTTARCWSRWSEATGCRARRTAPRPCTSWWCSAGRRTRRRGPPSSTCRPFWRTTSLPLSLSTSRGITSEHRCLHLMSSRWLPTRGGQTPPVPSHPVAVTMLQSSSTDSSTSKLHTNLDGAALTELTIRSKEGESQEFKMTAEVGRDETSCVV